MGKITSRTVATRDDQVTQLASGPFSILSGSNLIRRKPPTLRERVWLWWTNLLSRRAP